jgi:hypothetical protein
MAFAAPGDGVRLGSARAGGIDFTKLASLLSDPVRDLSQTVKPAGSDSAMMIDTAEADAAARAEANHGERPSYTEKSPTGR